MKKVLYILLFLFPAFSRAQLLVYTVAGSDTATRINDGGPATSAGLSSTEGIWLDGSCNLYISDGAKRIRKVNNVTGIITTIAGTGTMGYSGDGGPATNAQISIYGLYADAVGNVYFADPNANRIRRVDALTGTVTTFAGTGTAGYNGDGIAATSAELNQPGYVYGDNSGNIYIGEYYLSARLRKVNTEGIISTIVGTGTRGYSGDGGPATKAQVENPAGMLFDQLGNFYFADRGNSIIRKINPDGIITTFAGVPDSFGYTGDGGPATAAQMSGPISFVIDYLGNMVIGDNQNNYLREVNASTGIISTIGGMGAYGSQANGIPATAAAIHPEFMYLDRSGNIYFSDYGNKVRKVINYNAGELYGANDCGETAVPIVQPTNDKIELYPNPAIDELHIKMVQGAYTYFTITNSIGQTMLRQYVLQAEMSVPIAALQPGVYYINFKGGSGSEVRRFVKVP